MGCLAAIPGPIEPKPNFHNLSSLAALLSPKPFLLVNSMNIATVDVACTGLPRFLRLAPNLKAAAGLEAAGHGVDDEEIENVQDYDEGDEGEERIGAHWKLLGRTVFFLEIQCSLLVLAVFLIVWGEVIGWLAVKGGGL